MTLDEFINNLELMRAESDKLADLPFSSEEDANAYKREVAGQKRNLMTARSATLKQVIEMAENIDTEG